MRISAFLLTIFVAILGAAACPAQAAAGNTLKDELRIFTDDIAVQCGSVKEQLEDFKVKADPLTGFTLEDAVRSLCVCLPARTQALTSTLSADELARPIGEEDFLKLFNSAVIDKCAAEQMQTMYGEQCRKRFSKAVSNAPRYCSCMKEVVSEYSEATSAAIAAAASDYLPLAAEAEKNGEPVPRRPPILEAYFQADQGCKSNKDAPEATGR